MKNEKGMRVLIVGEGKQTGSLQFVMSADVASMMHPDVPSEIQIVPIGEWRGYQSEDENGKKKLLQFKITPESVSQMVQNFNLRGKDVVLDYEHQTLTGQQAPAAGWFKRLIDKGNLGLWAAVDWTDKALQYLKNKEYRFLSPVFTLDGIDPVSGKHVGAMLLHAALTNDPFFAELQPIVSKDNSRDPAMLRGAAIYLIKEDLQMNKVIAKLREVFKLAEAASEDDVLAKLDEHFTTSANVVTARNKIVGVLGLKPEATSEEIEAKATGLVGALAFKGEVTAALGLKPDATLEEVKALAISGKDNSKHLAVAVAKLADLEGKEFNREFDRIIAKAFFEGRIHPTQPKDVEWLKSNKDLFKAKGSDGYEEYWSKQPAIAPVGKLPTDVVAAKAGELSDDERAVAKMVGVSEATVKLHNKAN